MKRSLTFLTIAVGLGVWISYLVFTPSSSDHARSRFVGEEEVVIKVVRATKTQVAKVISANGKFQALAETEIASPLAGIVTEMRYDVGDMVSAGAVVATIQSKELLERLRSYEAAIKEAEADLRDKEIDLTSAETKVATTQKLLSQQLIARQELDQVELAAKTARAQVELAQAKIAQQRAALAQARYLLNLTQVTAPVGGMVMRRWVRPGVAVKLSTPILSLANLETMKVVVSLSPPEASLLRMGMDASVSIEAPAGRIFKGKVSQVHEARDSSRDPAGAEIYLANGDGALKPGMVGDVSIMLGTKLEIVVPKYALVELDGHTYLFTVAGGRAVRRSVIKGLELGGNVVITAGIEEGEMIVIAGQDRLQTDRRVRVTE
jgi:membrane fusion protein, multidrug efflux system